MTSVLATTGLPAERLDLEIIDTAVLTDLDRASARLERLRNIGVAIVLDDFGTGFSSLALVRALPLTRIKIDHSSVSDIDAHDASTAVIQCVVALCQGYGLVTTAEGVETERQRSALVACGCDTYQSYLYGRPSAVIAATAALFPSTKYASNFADTGMTAYGWLGRLSEQRCWVVFSLLPVSEKRPHLHIFYKRPVFTFLRQSLCLQPMSQMGLERFPDV